MVRLKTLDYIIRDPAAAKAVSPSRPPPSRDVTVQADAPTPPPAADAAVQAVVQTTEEAVQADPPPHHPSQGVVVLAEQGGPPLPSHVPPHHRLEDLLCRDTEYLPGLGQLPRVTVRDDRLD